MGNLPSGLLEEIDDDEDLARFLTSSSQYNSITVKPVAFLPSSDHETSVFRHGLEPAKNLWQIGEDAIGASGRSLYGVALLKATAIRAAALEVFADEPPLRHAAVRNWPTNPDPDLQKAQRREIALELACAAGKPVLIK